MVLEVTTFRLMTGVDDETFLAADKAVQTEVFPNTPGYLRRTTARSSDGEWLVVVLWAGDADIAAFEARTAADATRVAFDELVDRATVATKRYVDIGG